MENTVHLQWVGRVKSKSAREFEVGEAVMWNGGTSATVVAVRRVSACYLMFTFRLPRGGVADRKVKADRQLGVGVPA